MITITARLQPAVAARVCGLIDQHVMTKNAPVGTTLAQQRADALDDVTTSGGGGVDTELVIHVGPDSNTMADGTPLTDNTVVSLLPDAFISLLIHDAQRRPIDASPRRRSPTRRQRRVVDRLHPQCNNPGCTVTTFLQYDHKIPFSQGGPTTIDNLQRLCGPHNRAKNTDTG